jgi:endonuclease III
MSLRFRFAPHGRQLLHNLDHLLDKEYGAPEQRLGNQHDPLDEAVYIILSFQTDIPRLQKTWQSLRTALPRWQNVDEASPDEIAGAIRLGGLHHQKAKAIKRLLQEVRRQFGKLDLFSLREMADLDAERTLTRLPGISWKGARCILLYSLDRQVLPVDGNTFRILQRTGVIPLTAVYRRLSLHDGIQNETTPARRRRFHVNLVVHGQKVCLPQNPNCEICAVTNMCPRHGLTSEKILRSSDPESVSVIRGVSLTEYHQCESRPPVVNHTDSNG